MRNCRLLLLVLLLAISAAVQAAPASGAPTPRNAAEVEGGVGAAEAACSPRVDLATPNLQEMVSKKGHIWKSLAMRRRSRPKRAATEEGGRGDAKERGSYASERNGSCHFPVSLLFFLSLCTYAECLWSGESTLSTFRSRAMHLNAQPICILSSALFPPLVRFSVAFATKASRRVLPP